MGLGVNVKTMVMNRIAQESQLFADFVGGVSSRFPQVGTGFTATPTLFYTQGESVKESGKLKPVIVVQDGGSDPAPDAVARNGYVEYPLVYGYVPDTPTGDAMLADLESVLSRVFSRDWYVRNDGVPVEFILLDRQPIREGDEFGFPSRQFTIWRIQATYIRPTGV